MATIEVKPTWRGVLPLLLAALESDDAESRVTARKELTRMADAADRLNASMEKPKDA